MMTKKVCKRWAKREEYTLTYFAEKNLSFLAKKLPGRSNRAIISHLREMGIKPHQETFTCKMIIKMTGYDRDQLYRARDKLSQRWSRGHNTNEDKGIFRITGKQMEALIEYLGNEGTGKFISYKGGYMSRWGTNHDCCVNCGNSGTGKWEVHYGKGLCHRCYWKAYVWSVNRIEQKYNSEINRLKKRHLYITQAPCPPLFVKQARNIRKYVAKREKELRQKCRKEIEQFRAKGDDDE